eukprot:jgi/Mesen1/4625/ME000237S03664
MTMEDIEGVLLYYKYVQVSQLAETAAWFSELCERLRLVGRVRIASEGFNVTLGGSMAALREHIDAVSRHTLLSSGVDFKLEPHPLPAAIAVAIFSGAAAPPPGRARAAGVRLSVRTVKELVTLRPGYEVDIMRAGPHISPHEFHGVLAAAAAGAGAAGAAGAAAGADAAAAADANSSPATCQPGRVTLPASESGPSAANSAATATTAASSNADKAHPRLPASAASWAPLGERGAPGVCSGGSGEPEAGVTVLAPGVRQFSDLPAWLDAHAESLRGRRVLMYCTGGVRCESASAYLRGKGEGFQDLSGGIVRYMEAFPDGGFFSGKNFVFDPRIAVGTERQEVTGRCLLCAAKWDNYAARCRCATCRMLVLVCATCQAKSARTSGEQASFVCEICAQKGRSAPTLAGAVHATEPTAAAAAPAAAFAKSPSAKSATSFRGRTASLRKRLRHLAELVYIKAAWRGSGERHLASATREHNGNGATLATTERQRKGAGAAEGGQEEEEVEERLARLARGRDRGVVVPEKPGQDEWRATAASQHDPLQYRRQVAGWEASRQYLQQVFREQGPFDGVLGFSQGAAVVHALTRLREQSTGAIDFRFAILCSGFPFPAEVAGSLEEVADGELNGAIACPSVGRAVARSSGSDASACHSLDGAVPCSSDGGAVTCCSSGGDAIACPSDGAIACPSGGDASACPSVDGAISCPSLHIYGSTAGEDKQISNNESKRLAAMYCRGMHVEVEHGSGHIISTRSDHVEVYKSFLKKFL